jgi:hypothetical protein
MVILFFFLLRGSFKSNHKADKDIEKTSAHNTNQTIPTPIANVPFHDTTFTLKKGDTTIRFKTYDGWVLSTGAADSTGKTTLYKLQMDEESWLTRGDGSEIDIHGGSIRMTNVDSINSIRVRVVYRPNH